MCERSEAEKNPVHVFETSLSITSFDAISTKFDFSTWEQVEHKFVCNIHESNLFNAYFYDHFLNQEFRQFPSSSLVWNILTVRFCSQSLQSHNGSFMKKSYHHKNRKADCELRSAFLTDEDIPIEKGQLSRQFSYSSSLP